MSTLTSRQNRWFSLAAVATAVFGLSVTGCPQLFPPPANGNGNGNENSSNTNTNANSGKGNTGLTGQYVGSERCMQCHNNQHFEWSQTLHGSALETLEAIGQGTNPDCIRCHVVGFGQPGGFVDRATTDALAGVGCEVCHGPGRQHVENVNDETLRPPINLSSTLCGQCHTGVHHPNFEEWESSGHAVANQEVAARMVAGSSVNSCGQCHSGETFYAINIENGEIAENAFVGRQPTEVLGITCVVCHDPHERTGNATDPGDGRDFQLRFAETVQTTPVNLAEATTDPTRFNICGQCHHDRGRDWKVNSRGPHHSVQANFYVGEMPVPESGDGEPELLVQSANMKHLEASEQCATCHMYRQDFGSEQAPAIAGHDFQVNFAGCVQSGCHNSAEGIETRFNTFKSGIAARIEAIKTRLGPLNTWGYSSEGGPSNQSSISDNIKKVRFLIAYVEADGSSTVHNTDYGDAILEEAERLLTLEGR
ncbi:MAG: multiheme c-type cytochrome [Phycisphaerae bacterium]|nr:multiheme c-type cytochrome [Phycisphaerae bacterium]